MHESGRLAQSGRFAARALWQTLCRGAAGVLILCAFQVLPGLVADGPRGSGAWFPGLRSEAWADRRGKHGGEFNRGADRREVERSRDDETKPRVETPAPKAETAQPRTEAQPSRAEVQQPRVEQQQARGEAPREVKSSPEVRALEAKPAAETTGGSSPPRRDASDEARGKDDDARGRDKEPAGKTRTSGDASAPVSRPPSTLAEVLERLMKQTTPPATPLPAAAPSPPAAPAPAAPVTSQPIQKATGPATPAKPAAPRRATAVVLPPIGSQAFASNEVLAANLSAAALKTADLRGFAIETTVSLPHLQLEVYRLTPPVGLDARQARQLLKADLPDDRIGLNNYYRLYRVANGDASSPAERTAPAGLSAADACKGDRCAGREVIRWRPKLEECSASLRLGVIDTGIDHTHPTFAHHRFKMGDFVPDGRMPAPNWHGTGVVALIAGRRESGTPGLAPGADVHVASVFFSDGAGGVATDTVSLLKALEWMARLDVRLINMSFAGPRDDLVQQAIERMSAAGVIFVAAAGNEGPTAPARYPAAYKPVIAVTAVSTDLRNYPLANRGAHIDVAAPGVEIWTAVPGVKEGYHSGTSFAAPYVTAVLATVVKNDSRYNKTVLLDSLTTVDLGPPGRDPIYGRGLLVADGACRLPTGAPPPAETARAPSAPSPAAAPTWQTSVGPSPSQPAAISAGFR